MVGMVLGLECGSLYEYSGEVRAQISPHQKKKKKKLVILAGWKLSHSCLFKMSGLSFYSFSHSLISVYQNGTITRCEYTSITST